MNWAKIWMDLFKTTSFLGIDMGFWTAMAAVALIVILMNAVFWGMKPKQKDRNAGTCAPPIPTAPASSGGCR